MGPTGMPPVPLQVLQHVRLPLLSPKFLVGTVGSDLLIKSDEVCRDLVDEAKNYLLLPQERPLMQGPRTRPRKPVRRGEVLFAGERGNAKADDRRKKRRACEGLLEIQEVVHTILAPYSKTAFVIHTSSGIPTGERSLARHVASSYAEFSQLRDGPPP